MFRQKLPQQEQGFTLVEVWVAILIVSILFATSMQAMVLATVFKIRAKQYAKATTWIQEDLEIVKSQAAQLTYNASKCNATSDAGGFGKYLQDNLPALSNGGTKSITGKSYTLTRTPTVRNVAPYNVLQLTYSVAQGSNPTVATINTEVIPDAAYRCPSE